MRNNSRLDSDAPEDTTGKELPVTILITHVGHHHLLSGDVGALSSATPSVARSKGSLRNRSGPLDIVTFHRRTQERSCMFLAVAHALTSCGDFGSSI